MSSRKLLVLLRVHYNLSHFILGRRDYLHGGMQQSGVHNIMSNPRLPPYPHPCTVLPLVQIKHSFNIPGVGKLNMSQPYRKSAHKNGHFPTLLYIMANVISKPVLIISFV